MNKWFVTVFLCFFTLSSVAKPQSVGSEVKSHSVVNDASGRKDKVRKSDGSPSERQTDTLLAKQRVKASDERTSRIALSTNSVDWIWYVTPNIEVQYAVHRRWTLDATAKYNNWTYHDKDADKRNRQCRQEYSLGFRFWPWYTYSGWWFGANAQYQDYSRRQFRNIYRKEEGDAFGLSVGGGYSVQIKPWLNLDFGIGIWGGRKYFKVYESADWACPECGKRVDRTDGSEIPSRGWFVLPNYALASLMFIF